MPYHYATSKTHRPPCSPRRRCGDWRECPACASARQFKIAGIAQDLLSRAGVVHFSTFTPWTQTPAGIRALRAQIARRAVATRGIWTVEAGTKGRKLHLNYLTDAAPDPRNLPAEAWTEIVHTSARAVAAYISKQTGIPTPDEYDGRLFGRLGAVSQYLDLPDTPATVQAAAAQLHLQPAPTTPPQSMPRPGAIAPAPPADLTRDEYREIARRHLATLRQAAGMP